MTAPADDLRALLDDLTALADRVTDTTADGEVIPPGRLFGRASDVQRLALAVPTLVARLRAAADLAAELAGPPTVAENGALRRQIADRLRAALRQDAP
jgi:hypothetical protein